MNDAQPIIDAFSGALLRRLDDAESIRHAG